jgi:hypothetical protein
MVGDLITFEEWEPGDHPDRATARYTGRKHTKRICHIEHGVGLGAIEPLKGLAMGYAILGLMDTTLQADDEQKSAAA